VATLYTLNKKIMEIKKIWFKSKESDLNKKNPIFFIKKKIMIISTLMEDTSPKNVRDASVPIQKDDLHLIK